MYSENKSAYRNGRKMRMATCETRNEEEKKKEVVQTICMEIHAYIHRPDADADVAAGLGVALLSGWGRR